MDDVEWSGACSWSVSSGRGSASVHAKCRVSESGRIFDPLASKRTSTRG
jgi:hypothetical protein